MTRISTVQLNNLVLGSAMSTQVQYAQAETQQASGLVATDFADLGGANSSDMLNLQHEIEQGQTWSSDATTIGYRTQAMYSSIGNMASSIASLQSQISAALASPDTSTLAATVQSLQQNLVAEINTNSAGVYVFAGSNTAVQPVTPDSLANYQQSGGLSTGYYTGDDTVLSVQVSSVQTVSYGVTADNSAIEQAMRAVQAASDAASGTLASGTTTEASPTTGVGALNANDQFTINGLTVTIANSGESLQDVASDINSAASSAGSPITAKVVYNGSSYALQVSSGSTATGLTFADVAPGTAAATLGLPTTTTSYSDSLTTNLKSALTVANGAETALSNLQESVAANSSQLSSISTQQTTYVTYLQNALSGVKDVDTAQAAANVTKYQTQLQASYLAVAQISKISLAQYL